MHTSTPQQEEGDVTDIFHPFHPPLACCKPPSLFDLLLNSGLLCAMLAAMLAQLDASFEDAKAECDTLAEESSAWLKETVTRTEKQLLNHTCVRRNPLRAAAGPCEQSARRLRMWHGAASLPDHMRIAAWRPACASSRREHLPVNIPRKPPPPPHC